MAVWLLWYGTYWGAKGTELLYHATVPEAAANIKNTGIDFAVGSGRWGRGFYAAEEAVTALAERPGSEKMVVATLREGAKILDLVDRPTVELVETALDNPGAIDQILRSESRTVSPTAEALNAWAKANGFDGLRVPSVQAPGGVNLVMFGKAVVRSVESALSGL